MRHSHARTMVQLIADAEKLASSQTIAKPNVSSSLWAFMYNSCIHESSWATVSLHYSKDGAEKALAWHKEQKRIGWQRIVDTDEDKGTDIGFDVICPFGIHEDWCVEPVEVLP